MTNAFEIPLGDERLVGTTAQHTSAPWYMVADDETSLQWKVFGCGRDAPIAENMREADARRIIRAVNCHADLLAALQMALDAETPLHGPTEPLWAEHARAAIAKATGK